MPFKIKTAKITGTPDQNSWSQVHDFKPEERYKLEKRGRIVAVIATKKKEASDSGSYYINNVSGGREVLSRLHEEYYGNLTSSPFVALKEGVSKVLGEFTDGDDVEIAVCASVNGTIYLAAGGGAQVWILREGKLTKLLSSDIGKVNSASGNVHEGDRLVLGTKTFFTKFQNELAKTLSGGDLEKAAEIFTQLVHADGDGAGLGAALVSFDGPEDTVEVTEKEMDKEVPQETDNSDERPFSDARPPSVYIEKSSNEKLLKRKKTLVSVGAILVILLVISMFFGIRRKKEIELKQSYEGQLQEAQHKVEESLSLYSVDDTRARQLFGEGKVIVDNLTAKGIEDEDLTKLKNTVDENTGKILGEYYATPAKLVDLSLLTKDFNGDKAVSYGKTIYVMDSDQKKIASVSFDGKNSQVIAGPNKINEIEDLVVYADRVFAVNSKGVYEVENDGINLVVDRDWEGDVISASFAGNIYVVDKQANEILRFAGLDNQFAAGQDWLAKGVETDLSNAKDIAIDGYIWVLEGTDILKFSLGNPQRFEVSGVTPGLGTPLAIFTGDEIEYLYILDPENSRVVVTDKDGKYVAQYISDEIKNAKDLVVSEKDKLIILLTGENLISIDIKHM